VDISGQRGNLRAFRGLLRRAGVKKQKKKKKSWCSSMFKLEEGHPVLFLPESLLNPLKTHLIISIACLSPPRNHYCSKNKA
jgi:hypothetical protein